MNKIIRLFKKANGDFLDGLKESLDDVTRAMYVSYALITIWTIVVFAVGLLICCVICG